MNPLLQSVPKDDPVYRLFDKKRWEGKPYYVYMTSETKSELFSKKYWTFY